MEPDTPLQRRDSLVWTFSSRPTYNFRGEKAALTAPAPEPQYGFTFATATVTPKRDLIVTTKENVAQLWRFSWTPDPPQ